jgi:hypothetical protein
MAREVAATWRAAVRLSPSLHAARPLGYLRVVHDVTIELATTTGEFPVTARFLVAGDLAPDTHGNRLHQVSERQLIFYQPWTGSPDPLGVPILAIHADLLDSHRKADGRIVFERRHRRGMSTVIFSADDAARLLAWIPTARAARQAARRAELKQDRQARSSEILERWRDRRVDLRVESFEARPSVRVRPSGLASAR